MNYVLFPSCSPQDPTRHLSEYYLFLNWPVQAYIIVKAFCKTYHEDQKEQLQSTIANSNVASSREEQTSNSELRLQ